MSFVDMMKDDVWTEADVVNRTENMIRSKYSQAEELILNRKMSGVFSGLYSLTADEQAELQDFNVTIVQSRAAGVSARADMALLQLALNVEAVQRQLDAIPADAVIDSKDDPVLKTTKQQQNATLASQRASLQATIDAAAQTTKDLVAQRKTYRDALNPVLIVPPDPNAPTPPTP